MPDLPLEIDVQSVQQMLIGKQDFLLLDCREPDEHAVASISGAVLLPMSEMMQRAEELEAHKYRPIVVHCHKGGRSMRITKWLREQGYPQTQSLAGGIDAWSLQVDPTVPRY